MIASELCCNAECSTVEAGQEQARDLPVQGQLATHQEGRLDKGRGQGGSAAVCWCPLPDRSGCQACQGMLACPSAIVANAHFGTRRARSATKSPSPDPETTVHDVSHSALETDVIVVHLQATEGRANRADIVVRSPCVLPRLVLPQRSVEVAAVELRSSSIQVANHRILPSSNRCRKIITIDLATQLSIVSHHAFYANIDRDRLASSGATIAIAKLSGSIMRYLHAGIVSYS